MKEIIWMTAMVVGWAATGTVAGWTLAGMHWQDARIMAGPEWADARGQLRRSVYWSGGRLARGERLGDVVWVDSESGERWVPGRRLLDRTDGKAAVLGEGSLEKALGTLAAAYSAARDEVPRGARDLRRLLAVLGAGLGGLVGLGLAMAWHLGIRSGRRGGRRR